MATPGIYKNFEAEGEIGPYVIVTHGTADYAVKAATGATVALVGTTDELGKLSNASTSAPAAFPKWRSAEPWPQAIL